MKKFLLFTLLILSLFAGLFIFSPSVKAAACEDQACDLAYPGAWCGNIPGECIFRANCFTDACCNNLKPGSYVRTILGIGVRTCAFLAPQPVGCCTPDRTCHYAIPSTCTAMRGIAQAGPYNCTPTTCTEGPGACCSNNNVCTPGQTQAACEGGGGRFIGTNSVCNVNTCVEDQRGACCNPVNNACSANVFQTVCQQRGGSFIINATCADNPCDPSHNVNGSTSFQLPNPLCLSGGVNGEPCVTSFTGFIEQITTYLSGLIAILATIALVYAGFLYVTSAGNEGRLGSAKKALLYAIVGTGLALAGAGLVAALRIVLGSG